MPKLAAQGRLVARLTSTLNHQNVNRSSVNTEAEY